MREAEKWPLSRPARHRRHHDHLLSDYHMQKQQEILFPRRDASSEEHASQSFGFEPCEDDGSRILEGWNPLLLLTWHITSQPGTPLFPQ